MKDIEQIGVYVSNTLNDDLLGLAELTCSKFIEYLNTNGFKLSEKFTTVKGSFLMVENSNAEIKKKISNYADKHDLGFIEISRYNANA